MKTISRYIMTLALLLTAVTGAWATTDPNSVSWDNQTWAGWAENVTTHTVGDITITATGSGKVYQSTSSGEPLLMVADGTSTITFSSAGAPFTSIKIFAAIDSDPNIAGWTWDMGHNIEWSGTPSTSVSLSGCNFEAFNITFTFGTAEAPITVEPVVGKTNEWTFSMPGSDVVLTPIYAPTKVTLAANDKTMGTVEVAGQSKVEWTADTWKGWTQDIKEYTVDDITMTSSQSAHIREYSSEDQYNNSLFFFVRKMVNDATVTFSTTGDPFSRIEFTMIGDYSQYNPDIIPNDNWTFEGKSAVWEGEATKSLTLQSCSTSVSKITFYKGAAIPDGVTVNGDGTFTVAQTATVKVKAIPAEGYKFLYWEDDQTNTDPVREVTIEPGEEDMIITAIFEEMTYTATFTAANANTIEAGKATVTVGGTAATVTEGKLQGVKMGSEVKMTAKEGYKFRKVEVKKKAAAAAAEGHALSASAVGEIVGSDGKAYAIADKDNLPSGVTAVAMVAYKSGSNGLAIQLNGSPVEKEWDEAKTYAEGLSAVTGGTWRLPSKADWQNMFLGCAVSGDATSADDTMNPIAGFKAKIAATGITWKSFYYWSSTEHVMGAWSVLVSLDDSNAAFFDFHSTSSECTVLGCLAF